MSNKPVAIAVLTNADRRPFIEQNLKAFIDNTSYRPLHFCIFNNGSTDDTKAFLENLRLENLKSGEYQNGITYEIVHSDIDLGCSKGVNAANAMLNNSYYEYSIFLESDWTLLHEKESGASKKWLDDCINFLDTQTADYVYLRRFRNDKEASYHGWDHHIANTSEQQNGNFLKMRFVYSNNPHIRRTKALYDAGTLPLKEFDDDKKGNAVWGQAEHNTKVPQKYYCYWPGLFVHESTNTPEQLQDVGCFLCSHGNSKCKYGLLELRYGWCGTCDLSKGYKDWIEHKNRFYQFNPNDEIKEPIVNRVGNPWTSHLSKVDWRTELDKARKAK